MTAFFQMACNRVMHDCGCTEWDQFEDGRWVHRRWPCWRHGEVTGA